MFHLRAVIAERFFIFCIILVSFGVTVEGDDSTITKWANKIGSDLWNLAEAVAQPSDIKSGYRKMNARVEDKSGEELIEIISTSVGRMLSQKMDAVRRIMERAERAAELFNDTSISNWTEITPESAAAQGLPYVSSKYSTVEGRPPPEFPKSIANNSFMYTKMELTPDSHFYNIPVNTNFSSVHVPTNIHDLARDVNQAIQWSKELDDVFRKNYRADPALSWQYFGSSTGILRHFPAMEWRVEQTQPDRYDCRMRSWFIESATCSKHMVILLDISGSMEGMSYTIAKATAAEILDTLSNNDFVTIVGFTNITIDVVECFNDTLVQATPENIKIFKESMEKLNRTNSDNLTRALDKAFDILEDFRSDFCDAETPCTQAIMLVTDGVDGNLTQVYEKRNRLQNGTHIPVRVFTYLLGRDVTNVREIQWMACKNRGYYSHIHGLSEVREQVLKYIPVIARPLVLQEIDHPLIWTHAYADISNPALATWLRLVMKHPDQKSRLIKHLKAKEQGVQINEDDIYITKTVDSDSDAEPGHPKKTAYQEHKLLTTASVPAYDRKANNQKGSKVANLLGVAGTDVPMEEINRLTLPWKLGVNGYAFIVSNNGYVILHPALRPASRGKLKDNYNSIDLTEVEIIDDDREPRNPGKLIMDLRLALVNHESNSTKGVPIKFHYDDYRRVTVEKHDYFYTLLPGTPFGLAIVLPEYGKHWIKVGDEIGKNKLKKVKISDFFTGNRWRVHPTWVYCRFHYLENHEFSLPEDEIRHFLQAIDQPDWEWYEQYEELPNRTNFGEEKDEYADRDDNETEGSSINHRKPACSRRTLDDDAYYCNEELMQLLVFDAELTRHNFAEKFEYSSAKEKELGEAYGVFLRFIATQSGLTRWQDVGDGPPPEEIPKVNITTEEDNLWNDDVQPPVLEFGDLHRRAVNEPWYKGAIFQHNINEDSISLTVPLIVGPNANVTVAYGIFPTDEGKKAPAAVVGFQMPMKSFKQRFLDVTTDAKSNLNCAFEWIDCYLIDQNGYVVIANWHNDTGQFFGVIEGAIMESMVYQKVFKSVVLYDYQALCSYDRITDAASILETPMRHLAQLLTWFVARMLWLTSQFIDLSEAWARKSIGEDAPGDQPDPVNETVYFACDEKRTLYIMEKDIETLTITNITQRGSRPFYAKKVQHTNLLLVVVNALYDSPYVRLDVDPKRISPTSYPTGALGAPCHKLDLNRFPRRALEGCYTEHPREDEIEDCGAGSSRPRSTLVFVGFVILLTIFDLIETLCYSC